MNPRNHFLRFVYYAQDLPKSKFSLKSAFTEPKTDTFGGGQNAINMMAMNVSVSPTAANSGSSSSSSSSSRSAKANNNKNGILSASELDRNVFTMPQGWHVCDAKTNYLPTSKTNAKNPEFPLVVCFSGHVRAVRQFDTLLKAVLEQQVALGNVSRFAVTENVHSGVTVEQVNSRTGTGKSSVPVVLCS